MTMEQTPTDIQWLRYTGVCDSARKYKLLVTYHEDMSDEQQRNRIVPGHRWYNASSITRAATIMIGVE